MASCPCRSWSSPAAPQGGAVGLSHAICMAQSTPTTRSYKAAAHLQGGPGVRRDGWGGEPPSGLCPRQTPGLGSWWKTAGLPWWLSSKESAGNVGVTGDTGSIPGSGRSPGGGHGSLLLYSCLENPTDRGAWRTTVQSQTQLKRLILHTWERGALKKVINFPTKTHHRSPAKSFQSPYLSISPSPQKQAAESSLHR